MSQQESVLKEKQKRDAHRNTIILETTLVSASKRRPRHLQYENDGLDFQRFVHSELVLGVQSNSNYSQFRIKNSLVRSSQLIIESETETETEIDNKADSDLPESNQQSKKKQENKRNKIPDLNPQNKKKKNHSLDFLGRKKPKKSETQRKTNGLKIQNTPKTTSVRSKPLNAFYETTSKELQLENSQIRTLFNGIESILAFTQLVRTNISTVVSKWNVESCLGKIFIDLIKFSQVYITYVNNYNKGNELLNQLFKNNRKFSNFIKNQEKDDRCRRLDLGSMLIMPVQRLPRYIIFLEQLCKNTPVFHYDYDQIQNAYKMIVEVTTKVNEGKRDFENIQQMESIKQSLIYNDLKLNHISKSPACKFIKSYDAVVFEKRDEMVEKSIIPFKVHLLTEQLWICSPKRGIFFNGGDQFELEYVIGFIFLHKIKKTRRGKIGLLYGKDSNKTIFLLFNDHDTSLDFYQQIQKYAHEKKNKRKNPVN